jgi:hypothetical protein
MTLPNAASTNGKVDLELRLALDYWETLNLMCHDACMDKLS